MLDVFDVANYFLSQVDHDAEDCISNLKLQKLCYYAQGFYLALHGQRLFDETLQAWQHGPVIPRLYHRYKKCKNNCLLVDPKFKTSQIPTEIRDFLDEIYNAYGQYSAWRLRDMTHNELPWRSSYNKKIDDEISDDSMTKFFRAQLDNVN